MRESFQKTNVSLVAISAVIFCIALLSLYSASHEPGEKIIRNYALAEFVWVLIALCIAALFVWLGYERWLDFAYIIFSVNILMLILVLLVGEARLGAKRWLSLGLFSLQPSEICKISFILALVKYVSDNIDKIRRLKTVLVALTLCFVPIVLIIKQPDLGTAILFLPILFVVLFTAGARITHLTSIILTGLVSYPMLWQILKEYQKKRLLVFLNPNMDPLGAGYTIIQSKIAIGSGGLFGKGWLSGTQNQLNFLPERHTDFIFSVIGEEWGFVGAIILLGLFFLLIRRVLDIADRTNDINGKLLAVAVVALLWFQVFVNIAMTLGLMPVVGLPLPIVSYGGSSLVTTAVLLALVISIDLRRKIF